MKLACADRSSVAEVRAQISLRRQNLENQRATRFSHLNHPSAAKHGRVLVGFLPVTRNPASSRTTNSLGRRLPSSFKARWQTLRRFSCSRPLSLRCTFDLLFRLGLSSDSFLLGANSSVEGTELVVDVEKDAHFFATLSSQRRAPASFSEQWTFKLTRRALHPTARRSNSSLFHHPRSFIPSHHFCRVSFRIRFFVRVDSSKVCTTDLGRSRS